MKILLLALASLIAAMLLFGVGLILKLRHDERKLIREYNREHGWEDED